jgi:hypothetical protein
MKTEEMKAEPTTLTDVTTEPKAEASKSLVDTIFDTLTVRTAQGLVVAKDALEVVARWLDGRAKFVGELAEKLSSTSRAAAEPAGETSAS